MQTLPQCNIFMHKNHIWVEFTAKNNFYRLYWTFFPGSHILTYVIACHAEVFNFFQNFENVVWNGFPMIAIDAERTAVKNFFPVIWEIKSTWYLGNLWFFLILLMEHKMFHFYHMIDIRDEPARCVSDAFCKVIAFDTMWIPV